MKIAGLEQVILELNRLLDLCQFRATAMKLLVQISPSLISNGLCPISVFRSSFLGFYSTPFWGRVYKWKFCLSIYLFICLSSLLIQTLSSRNIPQSTLITQPLPRLTSGVELCVNLTFLFVLFVCSPHQITFLIDPRNRGL